MIYDFFFNVKNSFKAYGNRDRALKKITSQIGQISEMKCQMIKNEILFKKKKKKIKKYTKAKKNKRNGKNIDLKVKEVNRFDIATLISKMKRIYLWEMPKTNVPFYFNSL